MHSNIECLELGMLSVYFNINNDGHNAVKSWLNSNENTPRTDRIWKILKQNENIVRLQTNLDILQ